MQVFFTEKIINIRGLKGTAKMRFCRIKKIVKRRQNYLPYQQITQKKAPEKAGESGKLPSF